MVDSLGSEMLFGVGGAGCFGFFSLALGLASAVGFEFGAVFFVARRALA